MALPGLLRVVNEMCVLENSSGCRPFVFSQ
jgi:hypothetical protein